MEVDNTEKTNQEMDDFEDISVENISNEEGEEEMFKKGKTDKKKHKKDQLHEELDALKIQNEELNDKYLRLFSEFDNYRKRTIKEKIELSKTASEELITSLLPVVDDFERALMVMQKTGESEAQIEGVQLIFNKLKRILEQKGLEEVKAMGEIFDTDYHEAVTKISVNDENDKGRVMDVLQKGYSLHGKIIRFSQVVVGS